jgi:acyl-CoA thioester hydrolase
MEKDHKLILPVVECNCRYRAPARYDDEIVIETRPALVRNSVLKFAYRILRAGLDGDAHKLLAEGETIHVVCDENLKRMPLPEKYSTALRAMMH